MTRLVVHLAMRDLMRQKLQVLCNLAMIVGIMVPLLTVLGAKNGVVAAMLDGLRRDPALLQIETTDNGAIRPDQADGIAALPGVAFVVLKSRSQTDFIRIRTPQGTRIRNARLIASGPGDPILGGAPAPDDGGVVISQDLAELLSETADQPLTPGAQVEMTTDAPGRGRQARALMTVMAILPAARLPGQSILVSAEFTDLIESFHDGYAVPDLGVQDGIDPQTRSPVHEGLRVNVATMDDVAPVRRQIEAQLNRNTRSSANQIQTAQGMIAALNNAFGLIATVGFLGVAAALIVSMVGEVARRRRSIATLALLGCDRRMLVLLPVVQSVVTVALGLMLTLLVFLPAAALADRILDPTGGTAAASVHLSARDLIGVTAGAAVIALLSSWLAGRQILTIDPAIILREAT